MVVGSVAQLGERLLRKQEAGGSTPPRSTFFKFTAPDTDKPMHRFLCPNANFESGFLEITDKQEIHHLKDVLRLKANDTVVVFDGKGKGAAGVIYSLKKNTVRVRIKEILRETKKLTVVSLACAIPKKAKFEFIIEKCTELGVDEIIPLQTKRTEIKLTSDKKDKKLRRYQTVAANAAKQSQRTAIPHIYPVTDINEALKTHLNADTASFIACLSGKRQNLLEIMKGWQTPPKRILFFIGPEGDFADEELNQARNAGATAITLGERVLKVDTAAISVVSLISFFFGL